MNTKSFWYLDIRGSLFQTIWCHPFPNQRKIERLTEFYKKSVPPKIVVKWKICANDGGTEVFFLNFLNRSIFLWFLNGWYYNESAPIFDCWILLRTHQTSMPWQYFFHIQCHYKIFKMAAGGHLEIQQKILNS